MKLRHHDRYDYVPAARPRRLHLADRPTARRLFRAQPGAFLLRRGAGCGTGARRAAARHSQLRVARLRQSRRRLVHARRLRCAAAAAGGAGQQRDVRLCAGPGRGLPRARRRDRGPRPHQRRTPGRARRGRRTRADRRGDGPPDGSRGPPSGRLARPVDFAQPRHARPAGRGGLSLPARLVHGRPAGVVPLPRRQAHPGRALSAGSERHSADRRPQGRRRGLRRHHHRPVRRDAGAVGRSGRW